MGENRYLDLDPDPQATEVTGPDWSGLPIRVASCLGSREEALRLLDWRGEAGDEGRRRLQEDYLEWRVVRGLRGEICRVELTTELPDYWRELAAQNPEETLRLVAEFADEPSVPAAAVYGDHAPFVTDSTPEGRETAFADTMLPPEGRSPYNCGAKAICCMVQATNTLRDLLRLTVGAAQPRAVNDEVTGRLRRMTAAEAIPLVHAAVLGRSSDPVLVERLERLAYEGRRIGFDDPLGVYIQGFEHGRLRQPDGTPVPAEWFRFSRGLGPDEAPDSRPRYQRLVFEVPDGEGCVGELIDIATEKPLRYGGQVAELVQLAVFLRISEAGSVPTELKACGVPAVKSLAADDCGSVRKDRGEFEAERSVDISPPGREARSG